MLFMSTIAPHDELSILRRVVDPEQGNFPAAAADAILRLDLSAADRTRMHELLQKNRDGNISSEEEIRLENYCRVGRFLDVIRSKARHSLQSAGS
jgi:hypothetical protein